jgi:hypothetical protein
VTREPARQAADQDKILLSLFSEAKVSAKRMRVKELLKKRCFFYNYRGTGAAV